MSIHDKLSKCHPSLSRGMVWCRTCGKSKKVDSAECFRSGWPECCGYTMTIDSPEERAQYAKESAAKSPNTGNPPREGE